MITQLPIEAGFLIPLTSMVNEWAPRGRPLAVKTTADPGEGP
jgi:hypothetical protein